MEEEYVLAKMKSNNWAIDPKKFLSKTEVARLRVATKARAKIALAKGQRVAVRDDFIINLALATGLRAMEIVALKCRDVYLSGKVSFLLVEKGKGGKRRIVYFSKSFKKHCKEYLSWKQKIGESIEPDAPLIFSSNTKSHLTTRAIEKAFKRCAKRAGLSSSYAIHCLRHTYATFLLKASSGNLRLVQKQLGHSTVTTTQVYADVLMPETQKAVNRLYQQL